MTKKPASADAARKIWLAGIGAYGRAFSEAQETVAKISDETTRVFEDLVAKGEEIERTVEARGRKVAKQLAPGAATLDERIRKMRERIGLGDDDGSLTDDVRAIEARLAAVEEKLDALLAQSGAAGKKPVKRKAAKKKA